jgi:hypothetical protein
MVVLDALPSSLTPSVERPAGICDEGKEVMGQTNVLYYQC